MNYLQKILTAPVYDVCSETPLELAKNLSKRSNNQIFLKREDMQPVFSFKLRGAYNKICHLSNEELSHGVICASAGNHAQGVALSAHKIGCRAVIVMPKTTPQIKIKAVKNHHGEVVLHGDSFDEACAYALQLAEQQNLTFIHPFDDPDVIAGQGTIGMEILRQFSQKTYGELNAVFCSIGGGGLISGVAEFLKRINPNIKIIGVETFDGDAMKQSLAKQQRIKLEKVGLFSDGTAVKQVGEETFRICNELLDDIILVDTDAICAAVKDVFEDTRSILEPAGALAVAGAKAYAKQHNLQNANLIAVTSGANMNFDRLRFVAERAEMGEQREAVFAVTLPERPGAYLQFVSTIGDKNITEFNYRYNDKDRAVVFVGISVENRQQSADLVQSLINQGYPTIDLTDDEMSKNHVRYMVGGHSYFADKNLLEERVFRFEFPEFPGALMKFLQAMSVGWNISLFHYRNHGADYGRILIGIQVPPEEQQQFNEFLQKISATHSYSYVEESENQAYKLFLK